MLNVFNIKCLIFGVKILCVATLVEYVRYLSNIYCFLFNIQGFSIVFRGFVKSVGALYSLSGLCKVLWGFTAGAPLGGLSQHTTLCILSQFWQS